MNELVNMPPKLGPTKRTILPGWLGKYGVKELNGQAICVKCQHTFSMESLKPNKLQRHLDTHKNLASLSDDARKRVFEKLSTSLDASRQLMAGSLNGEQRKQVFVLKTAFLIAKSKRPFVEGEVMIKPSLQNFVEIFESEPFHHKPKQMADSLALSDTTIWRRTADCAADISDQVISDFKESSEKSIALDESTDITSKPQLVLCGRYVSPQRELKEELLATLTLETRTRGQDIFDIVDQFFMKNEIDWKSISECNIDGAPAMIGNMNGFKAFVLERNPDMKFNHCIIHRQALASKELSADFDNVMTVSVTVINFVKGRDLNARIFKKICEENDSEYERLLFHNTVRWLSRGRALKRVFQLREELYQFLTEKNHVHAAEFQDPRFLAKLAFLTDVFTHMNFLNMDLQGNTKFVFDLRNSICGFINKLGVLKEEASQGNFVHFECYLELIGSLDDDDIDFAPEIRILCEYLDKLACNFRERFPGLEEEDFTVIQAPFTGKPRGEYAMELCQLHADPIAKLEFESDPIKFWMHLCDMKYSRLKSMATRVLVRFGTTYICESIFSAMSYIKNKYRSRLTDENLADNMKLATTSYTPRYQKIVRDKK